MLVFPQNTQAAFRICQSATHHGQGALESILRINFEKSFESDFPLFPVLNARFLHKGFIAEYFREVKGEIVYPLLKKRLRHGV